ncbi:hypothetical protein [Parendozoicomonas sp. Alg238-R29]|uniref:hypothetical protein n=1 Tax=Parendozoicomonas sp. Alg238-R29 TaxID=2993446 RepID=UPI00248DD65A|nr:hypothetical protein [Parendozoicomonas sp. Alg238-R29]
MTEEKRKLLEKQLQQMHKAAEGLRWSLQRCQPLDISQLSAEDEEKFETLTARFARMSDILIQKIFRLVDELDLESPGTVRDRINRAEKKGLIDSARDFVVIRELRNAIAHEYEEEALANIHQEVLRLTPLLLAVPEKISLRLG